MSTSQGIVEATSSDTRKAALFVTPAIVKLENKKIVIQMTSPHNHTHTIRPSAVLANFTVLTPKRAKNVKPISLEQLRLTRQFPKEAPQVINQLFQQPINSEDKRWYPTPDT